MKFIRSQISKYFFKHKDVLLDFYPGLNYHFLEVEILNYILVNGNNNHQMMLNYYLNNLKNGVPLEYISNSCYFYKSEFFINRDVLIPRNETELLVSNAVEYSNVSKVKSVLELGVGSGAIILSYLMDLNYSIDKIVCSDISQTALDVSKKNFFLHKNKLKNYSKVDFVCCDKFEKIDSKFDLILTNPPYIKEKADLLGVHFKVLEFEPHEALFIEDEKYDDWFYDFFTNLKYKLNIHGICLMEGHENHLQRLAKKFSNDFKIKVLQDFSHRDRFLRISHG